jgi:hypothetical protein
VRVPARLLPQALLRFEDVTVRGPAMGRAAGDLAVSEVSCRRAAVPSRELQLRGGVVVELRLEREPLVQFQTLTSR